MASNEKAFKAELVQEMRAEGAHVVVISGSYLAGIPDLYVKYDGLPGFWLELKYTEGTDRAVRLTPLQRVWLTQERTAGGMSAWMLCSKTGPREWQLFAGRDPKIEKANPTHWYANRTAGEKWYPFQILRRITERYEQTGK